MDAAAASTDAASSIAAGAAAVVVVEVPHLHSQQQEAMEEFPKKAQGRKMREKRKKGFN